MALEPHGQKRAAFFILCILVGQENVAIATRPTLPQLVTLMSAGFMYKASAKRDSESELSLHSNIISATVKSGGQLLAHHEKDNSSVTIGRHDLLLEGPREDWIAVDGAKGWDKAKYAAWMPVAKQSGKAMSDAECAATVSGSMAVNHHVWTWCKCPRIIDDTKSAIFCMKGAGLAQIYKRKYAPSKLASATTACDGKPTCYKTSIKWYSWPCVWMRWFLQGVAKVKQKLFRLLDATAISSYTNVWHTIIEGAPNAFLQGFSFVGACLGFLPALFKSAGMLFCGASKCKGFLALFSVFFAFMGIASIAFPPVFAAILAALALTAVAWGLIAVFLGTFIRYLPDLICTGRGDQSKKLGDVITAANFKPTIMAHLDDPDSALSKEAANEPKFAGKSKAQIAEMLAVQFEAGKARMPDKDMRLGAAVAKYKDEAKASADQEVIRGGTEASLLSTIASETSGDPVGDDEGGRQFRAQASSAGTIENLATKLEAFNKPSCDTDCALENLPPDANKECVTGTCPAN